MKKTPSLQLVTKPDEFFYSLVTDALGRQRIAPKPRPETEFYLVNLLAKFIVSNRLYSQDSEGHLKDEPLALLLKQALETSEPQEQNAILRHVGDVSLYVAGFFQDSLYRKSVDVDYYIEMGCNAYTQVSNRVEQNSQRDLYKELADRFGRFVDVFAEVSEKTSPKTERDLLRVYDLWVKTRSERAAKMLQEAGILTSDSIKKEVQ